MTAALISIGDELLRGDRLNTHPECIRQLLLSKGFTLDCILTLPDRETDFAPNQHLILEQLLQNHTVVLTTGGLGPTEDDQTRSLIARLYHRKLIVDQSYAKEVESRYGINYPSQSVSYIPEGAFLLPNTVGSAAGFVIKNQKPFPNTTLIALPGPPDELEVMLEKGMSLLPNGPKIGLIHRHILLWDTPEQAIDKVLQSMPNDKINISILPSYGYVEVILSSHNKETLLLFETALKTAFLKLCILGTNSISLEKWVITQLIKRKETLSTAESCTGGLIASMLTSIAGASKTYLGGAIVYSNESKKTMLHISEKTLKDHGPVSQQVAEELALSCKQQFSSTYALSIVGFLGPTGGSVTAPCGTVIIALATDKEVVTKKVVVKGLRADCQKKAAQWALSLLAEKSILE